MRFQLQSSTIWPKSWSHLKLGKRIVLLEMFDLAAHVTPEHGCVAIWSRNAVVMFKTFEGIINPN